MGNLLTRPLTTSSQQTLNDGYLYHETQRSDILAAQPSKSVNIATSTSIHQNHGFLDQELRRDSLHADMSDIDLQALDPWPLSLVRQNTRSNRETSIAHHASSTYAYGLTITDTRLRCFEHGCDGRTFSCKDNYRRHLREKNGAGTVICEFCLACFSRKSNRDKHLSEGKCKVWKALVGEAVEC